jgi:MYXO-CTERM domain-containing protein
VSGLAAIALLAIASTASATPVVQVVWQETGTSSAMVAAGTPLTADIMITPDTPGISSYGVSLKFDDDLTLASAPPACCELKLPSGFQFNVSSNVTVNVNPSGGGEVLTFNAATLANGPTNGTFLAGVVHFVASNPRNNGIDVMPGFFNTGIDDMFDNAGKEADPEFIGASVSMPEPTTALLLLPGLAGLAALRRRKLG